MRPEPFISFFRHANDRTTAPSFKTRGAKDERDGSLGTVLTSPTTNPSHLGPSSHSASQPTNWAPLPLRCVHLLERLAARKVARTRIYEVYPAASLAKWCLNGGEILQAEHRRRLKKSRRIILQRLVDQGVDVGDFRHQLVTRHDDLDALISALTAALAYADKTVAPPPELADHAKLEGWIHIPRFLRWTNLRALQFGQ